MLSRIFMMLPLRFSLKPLMFRLEPLSFLACIEVIQKYTGTIARAVRPT